MSLVPRTTRGGRIELQGRVLIHGAEVLLGPDLVATSTDVLLEAGQIAFISDSIDPSSDMEVIDATGMTLLPGFIDTHVHIDFFDPAAVLAGGVTTVRDLGWPLERIMELAAASHETEFHGPLILAAGVMLTAPGGYPTRASWAPEGTGWEVVTPREAADAVEKLAGSGATVIKVALAPEVGPTLDAELLRTVVEVAHGLELDVTAHISGLNELHKALEAGVDELAHMLMGIEHIPQDTIARMVAQGMVVVPTLSIRDGRERDVGIANVAAFLQAGGRVVYGTDLGNEGPRPGIDSSEIRAMVDAGMTVKDILRSATSGAAVHLGLGDKGVIATGKDADLVLLGGSPLRDASALDRVQQVWRTGRAALTDGAR